MHLLFGVMYAYFTHEFDKGDSLALLTIIMACTHRLTCVAVLVSSLLVVMVVADDTPALRGGSQSGTGTGGWVVCMSRSAQQRPVH